MKASQNRLDIYVSLRVGTMFVLSYKITINTYFQYDLHIGLNYKNTKRLTDHFMIYKF